MSIILEALKKAEKNKVHPIHQKEKKQEDVVRPVQPIQDLSKKPHTWIYYLNGFLFVSVLFVSVVVTSMIVTDTMSQRTQNLVPTPITQKEAALSKSISKSVLGQKSVLVQKDIPDLELNGIMMGNPPQVLLNNYLLGLGDEVEGVSVKSIHPSYVVLNFHGKDYKKRLR